VQECQGAVAEPLAKKGQSVLCVGAISCETQCDFAGNGASLYAPRIYAAGFALAFSSYKFFPLRLRFFQQKCLEEYPPIKSILPGVTSHAPQNQRSWGWGARISKKRTVAPYVSAISGEGYSNSAGNGASLYAPRISARIP
jgi:hypothetical protein